MNYANMNVDELKAQMKIHNLMQYSTMRKDELITSLNKIETYIKNKKDCDYRTFNFGDKQVRVNDEQYTVITAKIDENMRVLASAGVGKSTTLVCKIKYLVDHGVDPSRIIFTCFNIDAAESIKQKIISVFGFNLKLMIGTIDSIACRWYHQYFKKDYHIGINEYATELLKFLRSPNGDIITSVYSHIFFDEFQDINQTQFEILQEFHKSGAKIGSIGDDGQNIYLFRGANVEYILNFDKYFKGAATYKLVNNYRSTPEIINMANESIKNNPDQIQKEMLATQPSVNILPIVKYYDNIFHQNNDIINKINEYIQKGYRLDDIAVLSRNSAPLKQLEEHIEKYNLKNITNRIDYISLITETNSDVKIKTKLGHVVLSTIHRSKGMEYSVVFIINADDKHFPSETDKTSIAAERRLWYVAITRCKTHLHITFCNQNSKNKQPTKLTRFVQEIDPKYYNFVNSNKIHYSYDDYRGIKYENGVVDMIQMLNERDYASMREQGLIPKINPTITKIHEKHNYNNTINDYYLHSDFGEFTDRYISREIGHASNLSNGLIDRTANIIIASCQLTPAEFTLYIKYEINFKTNSRLLTYDTELDDIVPLLSVNEIGLVRQIEQQDITNINNIISKIIETARKNKLQISEVFIVQDDYLPEKFKDIMSHAYNNYKNRSLSNQQIMKDIYYVSLCGNIYNRRRRLLYKDVYDEFTKDFTDMFHDMKSYVNYLNPSNKRFICKKFITNNEIDINGEIDLLDVSGEKIIDFKCSYSDKCKLEWFIQTLTYLSILRVSEPDILVNQVEIYNPLQGEIYTFDLTCWKKEKELLLYLYQVRDKLLKRNTINVATEEKVNIEMIDNNIPVVNKIVNNQVNNQVNNLVNNKVNNTVNNTVNNPVNNPINTTKKIEFNINDYTLTDDDLYDLKLIFGNPSYKFIIQRMVANYNTSNNNHKAYIDKAINILKQKYKINIMKPIEPTTYHMVFDTETTGLPITISYNSFYPYTQIEKYNSSRLVQMSWNIYNNKHILTKEEDYIIKPSGFIINNAHIHHIEHNIALTKGFDLKAILDLFYKDLKQVNTLVGHNVMFDVNIIKSELFRLRRQDIINEINKKKIICTMSSAVKLRINNTFRPPSLKNLCKEYLKVDPDNLHNSKYDTLYTAMAYHKMIDQKIINK